MSKKEITVEEYEIMVKKLTEEVTVLRKTVQVQHETINRMMDAYITKQTKSKPPVNVKK